MSNRRRRSRREGFTLLEILLVAAILVILAGMGTVAYRNMGSGAYAKIARSEINQFVNACDAFYIDHQSFPAQLNDLFVAPSGNSAQWNGPYMDRARGDANDPWGRPYDYQADLENDRVIIRSAGKNKQLGDADDISNIEPTG